MNLPKVEANEIIEEMAKDGSKLLVVQALQRAAKNFDEMTDDTLADSSLQEEMEMGTLLEFQAFHNFHFYDSSK